MGSGNKYKPEYCDLAIAMGKEGCSRTEMGSAMGGVVRGTLINWEEAHPEFADALKIADVHARAWWDAQARLGLWGGKQFNPVTFIYVTKNRWPEDFKDQQDVKHTGDAFRSFLDTARAAQIAKMKNPNDDTGEEE